MTVRPIIRVLSESQIEQTHIGALNILSSTGIRVDSPKARSVFARSAVVSEDNRVRIPAEIVEAAIKSAPGVIDLYDRRGELVFRLGDNLDAVTRFGIGVTNLYYQNPADDSVVPFTREHMRISTRLGSALPGFDLVSTVGVLQDVPPERADLHGSLIMAANTLKPLVILVSEDRCFDPVLDLLQDTIGDLRHNPSVLPYVNPITPLVFNQGTTDKMFSTIERGLPLIFNSYGMSGASTPIAPAGALVLLSAELLAGLVFSQLIREGAPIVLGSLPAVFEMRTMGSLYTPQSIVLNLACAELMAHYGLPHSGTSGSGPGWGGDLPAAGMLWMNHLTGSCGKVGLAPFVGGNFDSLVFSPAMVVYSDEVIRKARLFAKGFPLDEEQLGLPEIETVGPGGSFLTAGSTMRLFREMREDGFIWPNLSLEKWRAEGAPKADSILREKTMGLIHGLKAPDHHEEVLAAGEAFIRKLKSGWR